MPATIRNRAIRSSRCCKQTAEERAASTYGDDFDAILNADPKRNADALLNAIIAIASRQHAPKTPSIGNTDFQFTRGLLGVSM